MLEQRTTTRGQTPALSGDFERATGHNLSIMYDTAGPVKNRMRGCRCALQVRTAMPGSECERPRCRAA